MRIVATIVFVLCAGAAALVQTPRGVSLHPVGPQWTRPLAFGDAVRIAIGHSRLLLSTDSKLDALSWASGDEAWSRELAPTVPPLVEDDRVFVAADGQVQALTELTGRLEWRRPVGRVDVPLVYRAGWLLVIGDDQRLRGIRAADGEVIWHGPAPQAPWQMAPVVDGDFVFGLTADHRLHAWRIVDGMELWSIEVLPEARTIHASNGLVYVAASGRLTAFRQRSGRTAWSYAVEMPIVSKLAADRDHVYIAALDNSVRAHRTSNGHMVWNKKLDARIVDGLTADGGMVLVPHSDGFVLFMLAANGQRAGHLSAPSADARGAVGLATSGYGPTLRLARLTVTDTARSVETFARQTQPITSALTLTGTPVLLTPPGSSRRP